MQENIAVIFKPTEYTARARINLAEEANVSAEPITSGNQVRFNRG